MSGSKSSLGRYPSWSWLRDRPPTAPPGSARLDFGGPRVALPLQGEQTEAGVGLRPPSLAAASALLGPPEYGQMLPSRPWLLTCDWLGRAGVTWILPGPLSPPHPPGMAGFPWGRADNGMV